MTDATEVVGQSTASIPGQRRLDLKVQIESTGPCRKKVSVTVPRAEIDSTLAKSLRELIVSADVPGFRKGRVPRSLVEKKYRKEVSGQVLQRVLMDSLEQLAEEHQLDAINEPDLDVTTLEIPEKGDFEFDFEVEVRPEFDLPKYDGLKIKRPVREISEEEVTAAIDMYGEQFSAMSTPVESPAEEGDFLESDLRFVFNGEEIGRRSGVELRVSPRLRFLDAEVEAADKVLKGAVPGVQLSLPAKISMEASRAELRGETVTIEVDVKDVRRKTPYEPANLASAFGHDNVDELRKTIRGILDRQMQFRQRQAVRDQVLEQISASASWELPENLVLRQVENALRREVLEMREAGYTDQQIAARQAEMRQNQLSETRQALKQHFILDKLATQENIEVSPVEKELEILNMAQQSGESPRKVRAQLERRGMMENLEAQIRERKAVDFILEKASFEDVPDQWTPPENSHPVEVAIGELGAVAEPDLADEEAAG